MISSVSISLKLLLTWRRRQGTAWRKKTGEKSHDECAVQWQWTGNGCHDCAPGVSFSPVLRRR
jgi:hypothetical protein